jgi:hypothetical protein
VFICFRGDFHLLSQVETIRYSVNADWGVRSVTFFHVSGRYDTYAQVTDQERNFLANTLATMNQDTGGYPTVPKLASIRVRKTEKLENAATEALERRRV